MIRSANRAPHHRSAARLLALLLGVVLSVTSLVGHAAMEACAPECTPAQVEMVEAGGAECGACADLMAVPRLRALAPEPLADTPTPATVEHVPLPPRRPPRA